MLSERELAAAIGSTAYGPDGEKIGTVEHFFTDDRTGAPTWVAVSTGLFGTRRSVVPATEASFSEGAVRLPVTREAVRTAPAVSDEHLDPEAEVLLRQHYGLATGPSQVGTADDGTADVGTADVGTADVGTAPAGDEARAPSPAPHADLRGAAGTAAGGEPTTADGAMTRSEERLRISTERVPAKRVRVVKYVVTEQVQVTVPIRREEIRIEEIPLEEDAPAPAGALDAGGTGGLPETIVLHAERPVVATEVVAVERVRLRTEWVQEQVQVHDRVRREQVDVDEDRG